MTTRDIETIKRELLAAQQNDPEQKLKNEINEARKENEHLFEVLKRHAHNNGQLRKLLVDVERVVKAKGFQERLNHGVNIRGD